MGFNWPYFLQRGYLVIEKAPVAIASAPPWMLVRLALETANHQQHADEERLAALEIAGVADYRAFLVRVFGFEASVEDALARVTDIEPSFVRDRAKTARLQQDLRALGMSPEDIATLPRAATLTIRSAAQALGWLFVIERHTLLHGLLRRHVERTLGDAAHNATTYFQAYGGTPGARFRELGTALCAYAHTYPPATIVAAATEAFRSQRHWYASSPARRAA
jgi:heme oxygenase